MKSFLTTVITAIFLTACNSAKNPVTPTSSTSELLTETSNKTVPQPSIEDHTVNETPQTPKENCEELPEVVNVVPTLENLEVLNDSIQIKKNKLIISSLPEPETVALTNDKFITVQLDYLLTKYVSIDGRVNYKGIKSESNYLREFLIQIGKNLPTNDWSKNEKLAYWMNAYNAMTIDLILRHQPLESIKDIKDPWKQRFWKLGDKYYNLDEIEHQILRKMGDPRIHFGINCASFSCPPLLNTAFTAENVDSQLDQLTRAFINDSQRNTITADSIEISKIFNWFSKDFKTDGSVVDFLNKYSKTQILANAKVRYMDYDWTLNE